MLQPSTSTASQLVSDSNLLLEDQQEEIDTPNGVLDEAGWQALLIQVDRVEGGP